MTKNNTGLHIIPMGGVGDMGMNLMLYRYGEDYLMVDCGVRFPDAGSIGVEHLVPNMASLREIKGKLLAIVLTHGHEDHIGSLRWVLKEFAVPVYGTPFTLGLVESRL
jgi:ribonuclease J